MNIANNQQLIEWLNQNKKFKYLYFWGHKPSKDGSITKSCFSQWFSSGFTVDAIYYPTAEHFMMAEKARLFGDSDCLSRILKSNSPGHAKSIGRSVSNFDEHVWVENRFRIVVEGNLEKFNQNPKLKQFLINTRSKVLVEASPVDKIWGIGMADGDPNIGNPRSWKGENLLGYALMQVREQLISNPQEGGNYV